MKKELELSKEADNYVVSHLVSIGMEVDEVDYTTKNSDFDIKAYYNGNTITFEVKNDLMSAKTGNVAIEFANCRQATDSGINITKADWWIHKVGENYYVTRTSALRDFTKTEIPHRTVSAAGDGNAEIYLFKVQHFAKICSNLNQFDSPEKFL